MHFPCRMHRGQLGHELPMKVTYLIEHQCCRLRRAQPGARSMSLPLSCCCARKAHKLGGSVRVRVQVQPEHKVRIGCGLCCCRQWVSLATMPSFCAIVVLMGSSIFKHGKVWPAHGQGSARPSLLRQKTAGNCWPPRNQYEPLLACLRLPALHRSEGRRRNLT